VDGAAVDSLIWDFYDSTNPVMTASTRVIRKSEPYPVPPVVTSGRFGKEHGKEVGKALLDMHKDPEGRRILDHLRIDRFILPPADWFENISRIEDMAAFVKRKDHGTEKP
jgi:phosphonate transport system substrate-binding protein